MCHCQSKYKSINFPIVHKIRKGGYDGQGVNILNSTEDIENTVGGAI